MALRKANYFGRVPGFGLGGSDSAQEHFGLGKGGGVFGPDHVGMVALFQGVDIVNLVVLDCGGVEGH